MARDRRMICRSSFTSKKLAKCTDSEHLLFYGLVLNADDEGRGDGDPVTISMVFANRKWSTGKSSQMMEKLSALRLISWYVSGGETYYAITNFDRYQQGSWQGKHKQNSVIPSPSPAQRHRVQCPTTPTTVSRDTDCVANGMEWNGMEWNGSKESDKSDTFLADFEEWWQEITRKEHKADSLRLYEFWRKSLSADDLVISWKEYLRSHPDAQYHFLPSTFLSKSGKHVTEYLDKAKAQELIGQQEQERAEKSRLAAEAQWKEDKAKRDKALAADPEAMKKQAELLKDLAASLGTEGEK